MSVLTTEDRQVFGNFFLKIGSPSMALLYATISGQPGHDMAQREALVVAVKLVDYVSTDAATCIEACEWILLNYPADPQRPTFEAVKLRLQAQLQQQAANPVEEVWIGAEPMVNRSGLRSLLQEIVDGADHGVIYVAGGLASGRSHSYKLIRHVARKKEIPHFIIDFEVPTDERKTPLRSACRERFRQLRSLYPWTADAPRVHARSGRVADRGARSGGAG